MTSYHSHPPKAYRRFESVCTQAPNAIAVVHEGKPVTYQQLQTQVLERSEALIRQGLADHPYMPLMANRCLEYLITMLACCKLGITYVSIEPSTPSKRLIAVLEQLGCNHLLLLGQPTDLRPDPTLTCFRLDDCGTLCSDGPALRQPIRRRLDDASVITVMFTSGTTGVPKGVRISQDGLLNLVDNVQQQVQGKPRSYVHHSSIGFDAALFEVWVPLLTGACVTLQPSEFNIDALDHCVRAASCDVLLLTTSLFHLVAQHRLSMLEAVRVLYVGGEVLKPVHARALLLANPRITLVNGYGPTENTVFSTWYSLNKPEDAERDVIPIGQFLHQVHGKIVDAKLQEVEVGTPGELLLTGANLALGYLDEALTPTRFLQLPEGTYYRTGDYVIQDEHGMLFYQGRIDEQVKIKGFRVEIAEVEHALTQLPGVAQAVVQAHIMNDLENSLHAFIVFRHGSPTIEESKLMSLLGDRLPHYMVPRRIHYLAELPLTANGKVDKRSLQPPEKAAVVSPQAGSAVLEIWSGILGTRNLQLEHSIYGYGASSLSVVMAHSRINEILGRTTPFDEVARLSTFQEWVQYYATHADPVTSLRSQHGNH
ncbi:coronamic acid synthetase CmaA [Pseudomonas syringae pv. actinidiae]|uniref:L-allo-isoleucine:holo-[CmaA peptidyl-carrier protein] ligase n=1 Tax=Pseudomonas syringae TaxID=317 RepID=UPI000BB59A5D|nr:L-allo-isoleucine:holo-[CmaA peptidyl-carrier protein] ligase [Pseudomonas syringae]PBK50023.1 coronamic acid synthetase CmaA [Pseudomonas syringae pv. actinidiae]PBK52030.1 coronamic acid synthetase CmaA [Pseudomonas syringae pv. actinidiae]RJX54643.1 coronamic acid synthetase CmaA [Pseudomonas syringae pv. actinidiae]RJX55601.1 coronamic acid synthetase CmaA [Pseudomonas syringae pv. actinidiae]RJX60361.1 coronamic acid synthetase CmaA [Pseudomonas syringae pv. actinidiae]